MKFKASDLPLGGSQKSTIDGLVNTIKKRGDFDTLRKKVWAEYIESVSHVDCLLSVEIGLT